jgi:hypothetical protein
MTDINPLQYSDMTADERSRLLQLLEETLSHYISAGATTTAILVEVKMFFEDLNMIVSVDDICFLWSSLGLPYRDLFQDLPAITNHVFLTDNIIFRQH